MARQILRLPRGTNAQLQIYTGPSGEAPVNTETGEVHVQDGATPGGIPMLRRIGGDASETRRISPVGVGRTLFEAALDERSLLDWIPREFHAAILMYTAPDTWDLSPYIQAAIESGYAIFAPAGLYPYQKPLLVTSNRQIRGVYGGYGLVSGNGYTARGTVFRKIGTGGKPGLQSYLNQATSPTDLSGINACIIFAETAFPYIARGNSIQGVAFVGDRNASEANRPFGIYNFRSDHSVFDNVWIGWTKKGVTGVDPYVINYKKVTVFEASDIGFEIFSTSNALSGCYVVGGRVAYSVDGQYHDLTACAADGQSDIAYWFHNVRGVTMTGCGTEASQGTKLRVDHGLGLVVEGFHVSGLPQNGYLDAHTGGSTATLPAGDIQQAIVIGGGSSVVIDGLYMRPDGHRSDRPWEKISADSVVTYRNTLPGAPNDRADFIPGLWFRGAARRGLPTQARFQGSASDATNSVVVDTAARWTMVGDVARVMARCDLSTIDAPSLPFMLRFENAFSAYITGDRFTQAEYLPGNGAPNPFYVAGSSAYNSADFGEYTSTVKIAWAGTSWASGTTLQPPIFGGFDYRTGNVHFYKADGTPYTLGEIRALGSYIVVEGYIPLEFS